ncbi:MAG: Rrf2 family transcriptional regulator [Sedimentisphaerales bacterium]|nr:Rrf2 family transcriptional regulator [Sedimentisphaerales bacterium]
MKVSTRTRYGIRAIIELAQRQADGPVQLRSISRHQGISEKYLEQLMTIMKGAGLIRSVRGARGGYMLARPASQITMDQVFRCLEGHVLLMECVKDASSCNRSSDCVARGLWSDLEQAMDKVLKEITLKDLAEKAKAAWRPDYEI